MSVICVHGTAHTDFVVENGFNSDLDEVVDKICGFVCYCENERVIK